MLRSLLSAVVLACVLILAPTSVSQKEISSAHANEIARSAPCRLIVTASNDSSAVPLPKAKPHAAPTKVKKKSAHVPTKHKKKNHQHHHTHHHHSHHTTPQKIFGSYGPSHLTSPPGCG